MTEIEQLILKELSTLREEVGEVRDVVRGWRGQLVRQAGLVAIAAVTALGQMCSGGGAPAKAADAGAGGAIATGEGGQGGSSNAQP